MWEKIFEYLTFTRKERMGVLVLLVIILLLFILPYFIRPETGSRDPKAYQKYREDVRKFQSGIRSAADKSDLKGLNDAYSGQHNTEAVSFGNEDQQTAGTYISREQRHAAPNENKSDETKHKSELFYFDPNQTSPDDWRRLGLPDKLILTISHYLQKGGSFRTAADLKKLYGLRADDFERLFPYVRISNSGKTAFPAQSHRIELHQQYYRKHNEVDYSVNYARSKLNGDRNNIPPAEYSVYDLTKKEPEELDINLADSAVWSRLPGIGFRLACRIVHFREKLGGFYSIDQVRETFGLSDSTFRLIRPFLQSNEAVMQKINLNVAQQEVLQAHPYIRWKLAKQIIQYREQHDGFKSVAELQQLALMNAESYKKLAPYLEVK